MANVKISELNELTEKALDDYLPIVDTSADETKKISIENLVPTEIPNIENTYSESTSDAYSCDYVNKFGKLLWSGSWTSGSITVNDSDKYRVFIVYILGIVACLGTRNYGGVVIGKYGTYSYEQYTYRVTGSGNTWTIDAQNIGGSDGTQNAAITAIYGLF